MNEERILELQAEYGLTSAQNMTNSGDIWKLEGHTGRVTSDLLEFGVLMLPDKPTYDYYGNEIPARSRLQDGSKGTLGNAIQFWSRVEDGDDGTIEMVESLCNFPLNS